MVHLTYAINEGFILSLTELRQRLAAISWDEHQWALQPLPHDVPKNGRAQPYVMIGYTNPDLGELPNHLCFLFPIALEPIDPKDERRTLVCLHPSTAIVISHGLYFEGDQVKQDVLEDWRAFWTPLGQSLQENPAV